jgi:3-methylcrotonyl-CoA carboxylase beta subunit
MPVLKSNLNTRSEEFKENAEHMQMLVDDLREKVAAAKLGGGDRARDKHLSRGKLLPRERVRPSLSSASSPHTTCMGAILIQLV